MTWVLLALAFVSPVELEVRPLGQFTSKDSCEEFLEQVAHETQPQHFSAWVCVPLGVRT